jgi:hypothetical protein
VTDDARPQAGRRPGRVGLRSGSAYGPGRPAVRVGLRSGFGRLWTADTVSQFGTRVTQLALPLAAVGTAGASAAQGRRTLLPPD